MYTRTIILYLLHGLCRNDVRVTTNGQEREKLYIYLSTCIFHFSFSSAFFFFMSYQEGIIFSSVPRKSSEDAVLNEKKKKKGR